MKQLNYFLGTVGSDTRSGLTDKGKRWVSFRMAVNHDYLNKETGTFETIDTVWYEVSAFGTLAENVTKSVHKGDSVFVVGRLKVREWTTEDGRNGATVGIAAEAVGFNLQFTGAVSTRQALKNAESAAAGPDGQGQSAQSYGAGEAAASARTNSGTGADAAGSGPAGENPTTGSEESSAAAAAAALSGDAALSAQSAYAGERPF